MRRRHSQVIDPAQIHRIIDSSNIGRLATFGKDGYPYITPVNFVRMDDRIYFHCAPEGEKLDNIAGNPRVCFEVDVPLAYLDAGLDPDRPICHLHQFYHCVVIRGTAGVVEDEKKKTAALNALIRKHEPHADFQPVQTDMVGFKACKVVEITPLTTTAKSDLAQNRPEEVRRGIAAYLLKRDRPGDRETAEAMGLPVA
ncbi:MAG: pyridoxamine 5'-phosphate oxidase family protein [Deltaproteobacteria bacterium]|nr:pyridoxamine 5'-phosphate oxidase family protein [Deltaproteobacteria bacterium]